MAITTKTSVLLDNLLSTNGAVRVQARKELVSRGNEAVLPLMLLLKTGTYWGRWEAAKALQDMKNPLSIQALIGALRDDKFEIRWLAAEGLINIGKLVCKPLAQALIRNPDSKLLQDGAHHVFKDICEQDSSKYIQELINALEGIVPSVEAPLAASILLDNL